MDGDFSFSNEGGVSWPGKRFVNRSFFRGRSPDRTDEQAAEGIPFRAAGEAGHQNRAWRQAAGGEAGAERFVSLRLREAIQ